MIGRQKLQKTPFLNISSGFRHASPFFSRIFPQSSSPVQWGSRIRNSHSPSFQLQCIATILQAYSPPPYMMGHPEFRKCCLNSQHFSRIFLPSETCRILQFNYRLVIFGTIHDISVAPIHSELPFNLRVRSYVSSLFWIYRIEIISSTGNAWPWMWSQLSNVWKALQAHPHPLSLKFWSPQWQYSQLPFTEMISKSFLGAGWAQRCGLNILLGVQRSPPITGQGLACTLLQPSSKASFTILSILSCKDATSSERQNTMGILLLKSCLSPNPTGLLSRGAKMTEVWHCRNGSTPRLDSSGFFLSANDRQYLLLQSDQMEPTRALCC